MNNLPAGQTRVDKPTTPTPDGVVEDLAIVDLNLRASLSEGRILTEVRLEDAKRIWERAQAREFGTLKPSGPVPDSIAENAPLLRVTADGEVELRLQLQRAFSPKKSKGSDGEEKVWEKALTDTGLELFKIKLEAALGSTIHVEDGFIFRTTKSGSFEKIGWLPGSEKAPSRPRPNGVHSREELIAVFGQSPVKTEMDKGKDIVFQPTLSEASSPEALHKILLDGVAMFRCYIEAVVDQKKGESPPREKIIIRVPEEKKIKFRSLKRKDSPDTKEEAPNPRLESLRKYLSIDSRVQADALRVSTLWEQATLGKLNGVSVGPVPYQISDNHIQIEFNPLGELRLKIPLEKGKWGEVLNGNGSKRLRALLQELNDRSPSTYRFEYGMIYKLDGEQDTAESFESLAVLPRMIEVEDSDKLKDITTRLYKNKITEDEALAEIKHATKAESNKTLVVKSGSKRITNEAEFRDALEEALLMAQVYLTAKGVEIYKDSPPREQLVVKPLPQENEDRPRSMYSFYSLFADAGERMQTNELLRAVEAQPHPDCSFDEIIGQKQMVQALQLFVQQMKDPEHFAKFGAKPPDAILLYGPPGNGKSTAAAAIANKLGSGFINVSFKELLKTGGDIEAHLKELLKIAEAWADHHPSGRTVLFLDEIDVHVKNNERFDVMLRTHLSGLERSGKIVIVAATNYPKLLSPGLRERFSLHIEAGNPGVKEIEEVLRFHFARAVEGGENRLDPKIELSEVAEKLKGYSCRRLKDIVNYSLTLLAAAAKRDPLRKLVTSEDIIEATQTIHRDEDATEAEADE